jgi:hypothetical protein
MLSQNSGELPNSRASRSDISGLTARRPRNRQMDGGLGFGLGSACEVAARAARPAASRMAATIGSAELRNDSDWNQRSEHHINPERPPRTNDGLKARPSPFSPG